MSVQLNTSTSTTTQSLLPTLQSSYNALEPFPESTDFITILETIYTSFQTRDTSSHESASLLLRRLNKYHSAFFHATFQTHLQHVATFLNSENASLIYHYLTLLYEVFTTTIHSAYISEWCSKFLPRVIEISTLSQALPANVLALAELTLTAATNKYLVFDNHDILLRVITAHKTTEIAHKAGALLFEVINVHDEQQRLTLLDWNEVFTVVISEQVHLDSIKEYGAFLKPFLKNSNIAFCQWNPEGRTLQEAVPTRMCLETYHLMQTSMKSSLSVSSTKNT
jgi:hypothetical protein